METVKLRTLIRDRKSRKDESVEEVFVPVLIRNRRYSAWCEGLDGPFYVLASVFGSQERNTTDHLRCYQLETESWGRVVPPRVNRREHFYDAQRSQLVVIKPTITKDDVKRAREIVEKDSNIEMFNHQIKDLTQQIKKLENERASLSWKRTGAFHSKVLESLGIDEQVQVAKSQTASYTQNPSREGEKA